MRINGGYLDNRVNTTSFIFVTPGHRWVGPYWQNVSRNRYRLCNFRFLTVTQTVLVDTMRPTPNLGNPTSGSRPKVDSANVTTTEVWTLLVRKCVWLPLVSIRDFSIGVLVFPYCPINFYMFPIISFRFSRVTVDVQYLEVVSGTKLWFF